MPKTPDSKKAQAPGPRPKPLRSRRRELALAVLSFCGFLAAGWCSTVMKEMAAEMRNSTAQASQPADLSVVAADLRG